MKKKKYRSIETLKTRYGYMFTLHWSIGFIVFFAVPIIQSLWYSFSDVVIDLNGVSTKFVGLANYKELLTVDPYYTSQLTDAITTYMYSLPIILLISIVVALLLNQKFRGRLFFRALYFAPVIIASGVVINLMLKVSDINLSSAGISASMSDSMFDVEDVIAWLDLPFSIAEKVKLIMNAIFDLVWSCGVQIVLVIAGLQSIPATLYEASKVEGATKWQEFWFVVFPNLGNVVLLVFVYTTVDIFTDSKVGVMDRAVAMINNGIYDMVSALLWFYFAVVGLLIGILLWAYYRILMKRWQ